MRYLLDTNQVLFICQEPARLTPAGRDLMWARGTELFVSAAAFFEIAIKHRSTTRDGETKLPLKRPMPDMLGYPVAKGVRTLPIEPHHPWTALDPEPVHRDPYDWLHLQQCQAEGMQLLTADGGMRGHPLFAFVG